MTKSDDSLLSKWAQDILGPDWGLVIGNIYKDQ